MKHKEAIFQWVITFLYWLLLSCLIYPLYFRDQTIIYIPVLVFVFLWIRFKQYMRKGWWYPVVYVVAVLAQLALLSLLFTYILNQPYFDFAFYALLVIGIVLHVTLGSITFTYGTHSMVHYLAGLLLLLLLIVAGYLEKKG